ncbi:MAG TPA: sigma 54-interacting transcriptional regulator, partial [Leptospiraceae bacterium]|nr:sigma 54-interacting transcriptional regulator [Leptospiraceae bacterium]
GYNGATGAFTISMNCAALNENLLESELFGHVKGAFTGAERNYMGRFEAANGGTLFLDEVSEMPPSLQVKLLRVIQEREIEKVGDHKKIKIDIRIVSATHRNLRKDAEDGRFRSDLFYRLAVVPIFLPSLRERRGDIPLLAHHFLNIFNQKYSKNRQFSEEFIESICAYNWPGNVRELQNVIEYSALISPTDQISLDSLPDSMKEKTDSEVKSSDERIPIGDLNLEKAVLKLEAEYIERALAVGKSQDEASRLLQISRGSLQYKLKNNPHLRHLSSKRN